MKNTNNFKCIDIIAIMDITKKRDSNFFLAISMSVFTFCFMFLSMKMHLGYSILGFGCLIGAVKYWTKVKNQ